MNSLNPVILFISSNFQSNGLAWNQFQDRARGEPVHRVFDSPEALRRTCGYSDQERDSMTDSRLPEPQY